MLKAGETWAVLANGMGSTNLGGVGSLFAASRLGPNAEIFAGGTYRKQSAYRDGDGTVIPNTGNEIWTGVGKAHAAGRPRAISSSSATSHYDGATTPPASRIVRTARGLSPASRRHRSTAP